jgi:hypothetical protein
MGESDEDEASAFWCWCLSTSDIGVAVNIPLADILSGSDVVLVTCRAKPSGFMSL